MLKAGGLISIFILFLQTGADIMLFTQESPDTASINSRTLNAFINSRRNPDMVLPVALKALAESRTIGYDKGIADASLALGFAYFAKYRADSALYYNMQAYDLYKEMDNPLGKARACYGLSYVFTLKSDLQESERYAVLSLNFFEEAGKAYNNIAQVYNSTSRYDTALIYLRKSLQLNNQMNYPSGIADSYHNIASTLLNLSRTNSALWYITNAVAIATETRNQDTVLCCQSLLCACIISLFLPFIKIVLYLHPGNLL